MVVNVSFPCLIPLAVIANHFAGGFGYHTNDARGAASRTAANSDGQYVPESVDMVIDSGIILHNLPHFSRLRSLSSLAPFWSSRTDSIKPDSLGGKQPVLSTPGVPIQPSIQYCRRRLQSLEHTRSRYRLLLPSRLNSSRPARMVAAITTSRSLQLNREAFA